MSRPMPTVLAQLAADDARPNASMAAIAEAYGTAPGWTATASAPFKSATKWSGASYGEHGNWVIGAPDVLLDPASPEAEEAERIGAQGLRVLLLGVVRPDRGRPGRARHRHPGRAGRPGTAGAPGRPRHAGLLRLPTRHGQGDLRGQRHVGGRGGRHARPARRDPLDARQLPETVRRAGRRASSSTPPSAGCARTRSGPWCTPCSPAGTRWR